MQMYFFKSLLEKIGFKILLIKKENLQICFDIKEKTELLFTIFV